MVDRGSASDSVAPNPSPIAADQPRYLEQRGEFVTPWMWHLLCLNKLKEAKDSMEPKAYLQQV